MTRTVLAGLLACVVLAACSSKPPAPAWQSGAHGDLERYEQAFLAGQGRAADADFVRGRRALAATGQPALVARAELTRCALQVASLAFEPCTGFEPLRVDAPPAERAYADYLAAQLPVPQAALLPPQHRAVAAGRTDAGTIAAMADPLAQLVAAGVVMRAGHGTPEVVQLAVNTASAQGWRRPLLAWLGAQLRLAEKAGAAEEAQRLRRRIDLVGTP